MEIAGAILLATVVLPFLLGWWIGNPVFAAAAWGALGLTLLLQQLTRADSPGGEAVLGIVLGCAISAAAAGYGGHVREKQQRRRGPDAGAS